VTAAGRGDPRLDESLMARERHVLAGPCTRAGRRVRRLRVGLAPLREQGLGEGDLGEGLVIDPLPGRQLTRGRSLPGQRPRRAGGAR
jgi:hypothetical protein